MNTSPQVSTQSGEVVRGLAASPSEEHRIRRTKVLVVDDYVEAAESTAEGLREFGCQVEVAHDGPSAVAIALRFTPDVCLLDLGLPMMDGYEVARRLRDSPQLPDHLRIIAVTGYGQEGARRRTAAAGFDEHLVKPVDLDDLAMAVKAATARPATRRFGHA
jgi:CheY-like chemotaxis protein